MVNDAPPAAPPRNVPRFHVLAVIALGVLSVSLQLHVALQGSAWEDEGSNLYAYRQVLDGRLPYLHFFYPDTPFLLVLGLFTGGSLLAARLVSVVLSTGMLALLLLSFRERRIPGVLALLFLVTTAPWACDLPAFTPHAAGAAASLLAYCLIVAPPAPTKAFGAGLASAVAAGFHIRFLPLVAVFAAAMALWDPDRRKLLPRLLAGIAAGLLPVIALALSAPVSFASCLFGQTDLAPEPSRAGRLSSLAALAHSPSWMILVILALCGLARRRDAPASLAAAAAGTLLLSGLLPSTHPGHLAAALPFLLVTAIPIFETTPDRPAWVAAAGLLALHLFLRSAGVNARLDEGHSLSRPLIGNVAGAIRQHAGRGEAILSLWPGYAALSGTRVPEGMESHLAGRDERPRLLGAHGPRLAGKADVRRHIESKAYRLVQIGRRGERSEETADLVALLERNGYRRVFQEWDRFLYLRD